MNDDDVIGAIDARSKRREERRDFFRSFGTAALVGGGAALAMSASAAQAQAAPTDADILNFALNLEYLEANFYYFAAFGQPIQAANQTGTGVQGAATGGRAVTFTDPQVAAIAREIAGDERAHVEFLRAALGAAAVAQPAIDVSATATGAFTAAARAAGVIGATATFDPYASDENFLLAAYIFEDVGVTAYKGAAPLITSKTYLDASAGILAAEAYHAGIIRTKLYEKGINAAALITASEQISGARDSLDGASDLDQGIRPTGNVANIAPTDGNGIAFSRTTGQVLNIVYLNRAAVSTGGFFPAGVNGTIRTSAAS